MRHALHLPPGQNGEAQRGGDGHDQRAPVVDQVGEAGQQHVAHRPGQTADHADEGPVVRVDPLDGCEGRKRKRKKKMIQAITVVSF